MRSLGVRQFRMSLAWPRLLPSGTGELNQVGSAVALQGGVVLGSAGWKLRPVGVVGWLGGGRCFWAWLGGGCLPVGGGSGRVRCMQLACPALQQLCPCLHTACSGRLCMCMRDPEALALLAGRGGLLQPSD